MCNYRGEGFGVVKFIPKNGIHSLKPKMQAFHEDPAQTCPFVSFTKFSAFKKTSKNPRIASLGTWTISQMNNRLLHAIVYMC